MTFFLFMSESFCLLKLETFGYKQKKKSWLFPVISLCLASIDVRKQAICYLSSRGVLACQVLQTGP